MALALLKTMRPRQWAKNAFLFAALVFDRQLLLPTPFLRTLAGFGLFCAASGLVYLINDLADLEQDRQHPTKRNRPLASGRLPVRAAQVSAVLLGAVTLWLSFELGTSFGLIILLYIVINLLYSFRLKHVPIIDVMLVASGFLLRVHAGVALLTVERFSPWLYVCMTLLALFMGFGKRRAEMVLLAEGANAHRRVLDGYTIPLLDQLIVIVSGATLMAYSLYTGLALNLPANHAMMLSIPFVVYGIFRYLQLIHVQGAGGAPEELILTDRPLLLTCILWAVAVVLILYFSP